MLLYFSQQPHTYTTNKEKMQAGRQETFIFLFLYFFFLKKKCRVVRTKMNYCLGEIFLSFFSPHTISHTCTTISRYIKSEGKTFSYVCVCMGLRFISISISGKFLLLILLLPSFLLLICYARSTTLHKMPWGFESSISLLLLDNKEKVSKMEVDADAAAYVCEP